MTWQAKASFNSHRSMSATVSPCCFSSFGTAKAGLLRRGGALLRAQCEFILRLARHLVAVGDDLGGLDHRHVQRRDARHQLGIIATSTYHLVALHKRHRLDAAAYRDLHAIIDDL